MKSVSFQYTHTMNFYGNCHQFIVLLSHHSGEEGAVCASSLVKYGPGLIAHCLAKWLVTNHIPAEFVAIIPSDPHDNNDPSNSTCTVYILASCKHSVSNHLNFDSPQCNLSECIYTVQSTYTLILIPTSTRTHIHIYPCTPTRARAHTHTHV